MKIYIVTNPENGWDCITYVLQANSKEEVREYIINEEGHEDKYFDDTHIIFEKRVRDITKPNPDGISATLL